ncbi:MAG TPA: GNAT family N-acetyltransferase [Halanaerobiales bacterium]|nr:GNAT family N-acetyltransferase [Halanaerobiales bacterium]
MEKENLLKLLQKEPLTNMGIIGFVENNPIKAVYNQGDTYIILGDSDHLWAYLYGRKPNELKEMLNTIEVPTKYFANIEDWMLPILTDGREVEWKLNTRRYYFPENIEIKEPVHDVDNLNKKDIEVILKHSHYSEYLTRKLIKERIEGGLSAAIREYGKLVAWGLTHDDKSLGFLHVIKEYRNKGYAQDIGRSLINKKRELNEVAYINIEPDNYKSINLSEGMGFKYDRNISWVKFK